MYFDTFPGALVAGAAGLAAGMWIRDRGWRALRRKLRRAGLPERAAAAPFHEVKPFATTFAERQAVALRAIYDEGTYESLAKTPESLGAPAGKVKGGVRATARPGTAPVNPHGLERFSFLGPRDLSTADLAIEREELNRNWGIVDSASCMRTLLSLVDGGARREFNYWWRVLAEHRLLEGTTSEIETLAQRLAPNFPHLKKADDSLSLLERLKLARENWRRLHPGGTAAWDHARVVQICTTACQLGYLDNGQAWAIILNIGDKAAHAFRSWEQVGESFVTGRYLHFGVRRPVFDEAIARLRTHSQSPWRTIPWKYLGPAELPT
jgi:Protein of unknown function (DUF1266)